MKTCNWPGCDVEIEGIYCSQHYFRIPKKLRNELSESRSGKDEADAMLNMRLWIQKELS